METLFRKAHMLGPSEPRADVCLVTSVWCSPQVPWSTGTECVAKYNFQATNEQDLPFAKGDVLTIIGVTRVSEAHSHAQISPTQISPSHRPRSDPLPGPWRDRGAS